MIHQEREPENQFKNVKLIKIQLIRLISIDLRLRNTHTKSRGYGNR